MGWYKQVGDRYVVFWLQCSQDGWDTYAGSKFVVEFQFSPSATIGAAGVGCVRERLPHFLSEAELNRARELQNRVIAKLQRPPSDYFVLQMETRVVNWYLEKFEPVHQPYKSTDDIWFRYHDESDVRQWAEFVLNLLPNTIAKLTI